MKLEKDKVKVILGDEMMEENMQSTEFINKQQKKEEQVFLRIHCDTCNLCSHVFY